MIEELEDLQKKSEGEIAAAQTEAELAAVRVKYLGRKGLLTQYLRNLGQLSIEEKQIRGKRANELKERLSSRFEEAQAALTALKKERAFREEAIDVTLPGRRGNCGHTHPVTQVLEEICAIFSGIGFAIVEGPEIEKDYYNFEALNIPEDHPARDMQDTFYVEESVVLRTHTSPVQVRIMEKQAPPVRIISPGRVYRPDSDVSHTPMFHQVEGLLVDRGVTFGDLKGILSVFLKQIFGEETVLRFRPSYFPFTEPSAEVDIQCVMCRGKGCRVCGQSGWLEILGSGMVDPAVYENVGYDPEEFSGFAFGLGVERIAMLKYGISDIRLFYENESRFLQQF